MKKIFSIVFGLVLVAGLGVMALLQSGLKDWVDRPRPTAGLVELRVGYSSSSFPAGHVMSPAVLYGFLLYLAVTLKPPILARLAIVAWSAFVLALTGAANIYVGVHWPSDVLGGYVWGAVLVLPMAYIDRRLAGR